MSGHTGVVSSVVFSPDGKRLATASYDGTAKVWDAASGQELLALTEHTASLSSVAFSPDGKRLVTASWDKTVREYILPVEELIALAQLRVARALTLDECKKYLHWDECPTRPSEQ